MSGDATLALEAQRAAHAGEQACVLARIQYLDFVRPKRQQLRQVAGALDTRPAAAAPSSAVACRMDMTCWAPKGSRNFRTAVAREDFFADARLIPSVHPPDSLHTRE